MQYILLDIGYQEVRNGQVIRITDFDGNTITPPAGYGGTVVDSNPPAPSWAVADTPAEPEPSVAPTRILTKLAYLRLFTPAERIAIRNAAGASPELYDYLDMLKIADEIDLLDADTVSGVMMLEQLGLIAPGRAAEVLNA